jgi:hypothetical protein
MYTNYILPEINFKKLLLISINKEKPHVTVKPEKISGQKLPG